MIAPQTQKLRTPAAAAYLGLGVSTLEKLRLSGDGPPYYKCGSKVVVYDTADIDAWLQKRRYNNTSAYPTQQTSPKTGRARSNSTR